MPYQKLTLLLLTLGLTGGCGTDPQSETSAPARPVRSEPIAAPVSPDNAEEGAGTMARSPLQYAIDRGMRPGADLGAELRGLGDYSVRSREDAEAICDALAKFPQSDTRPRGITAPLDSLLLLFQKAEDRSVPAYAVLRSRGTAELVRLADHFIGDPPPKSVVDVLFLLKVLAMYGTHEGAERVVAAARKPVNPDGHLWSVVLRMFTPRHPERDFVFAALQDPFPEGLIAVAFLDAANEAAREGMLPQHPFDCAEGRRLLRNWLTATDPDQYHYAHGATAALPFIRSPERDQLLSLAMDHPDDSVQMEAAWASARLGSESGVKVLARSCLDLNRFVVAAEYLRQLDRMDAIPEAARESDFQAKAEFAHWLAHPNELGHPPDVLEIVDHRSLAWPPQGRTKDFWLIRFIARDPDGLEDDDVGCGLVGSITFCLFSYQLHERPPEDGYAIHCYWEMERKNRIVEVEVDDPLEYSGMLRQWTEGPLSDARVVLVAELSPELKHPRKLVALATARRADESGWVVLDGDRSRWYPQSEVPVGAPESTVLMVHVGRELLGFTERPDRRRFLALPPTERDPRDLVAAYERLLNDVCREGALSRKTRLSKLRVKIGTYFLHYVNARAQVSGESVDTALASAYRQMLDLAPEARQHIGDEIYSFSGVLGRNFDAYVDTLIAADRVNEVAELIQLFDRHWQHNSGSATLGRASYLIGDSDSAECYLERLRASYVHWFRSEEMDLLARIWFARGHQVPALQLLVDCLKRTAEEAQWAGGTDVEAYETWFQHHRATFLDLFPDRGDAFLVEGGIPTTTLK